MELGIVTRTLYGMIDRGEPPAYRFGRGIRLQASDVESFVADSHVQPGSLRHLYLPPSGQPRPPAATPEEDAPDDVGGPDPDGGEGMGPRRPGS